jgi:hypothetical protein
MTRVVPWACLALLVACGTTAAHEPAHCQKTVGDADAMADVAQDPLSLQGDALVPCLDDDAYPHGPTPPPPGTCFRGRAPAADALVAPLPAAVSCEAEPPAFFPTDAVPKPTLSPELGYDGAHGEFMPWQDGDWVPLEHGIQGKLMVEVRFRVTLPGQDACRQVLQTNVYASKDCVQIGIGQLGVSSGEWQAPELFVGPNGHATIRTVLNPAPPDSWQLCGEALDLRLQVRVPGTDTWGEGHVRLRLYDFLDQSQCAHPSH